MSIGRGKGRPRTQLVAPTLDGFPIGSMEDEKQKWFHKKCTEQWQYNILTSNKAAEFREKERVRCKAAYHARKEKKAEASAVVGTPPHAELPDDDVQEDKREKSKELSRLWYVKHTRKMDTCRVFVKCSFQSMNLYQYILILYLPYFHCVVVVVKHQQNQKPPSQTLV